MILKYCGMVDVEDIYLSWNAAPEIIAAIVIFILMLNTTNSQSFPTLRNRMFVLSLNFTFFCIILNLLTIFTIEIAARIPLWINMVVNTAFFIISPFMPLIFIVYMLLFIFENSPITHRKRLSQTLWFMAIIISAYLIITIINIWSGWLFSFNESYVYIRGTLNKLPIFIPMFFIVIALIQAIPERKYMDRFLLRIISWFPLIAIALMTVQLIYPEIILSGSAMMIATLTVHLNFQVKKISEDNLTKLPNRETFAKNVEMLNKKGKPCTIILVSLDDFKVINDTYGQSKGDDFLIAIASGLKALFPEEKLYRYGGDEFAIIVRMENPLNESQMIQILQDEFHTPWQTSKVQAKISASIAILSLPLVQEDHLDPINLLDYAMRSIKNRGKGNSVVCDENLLRIMKRRNRLIELLKQGIASGSFSLNYQPIYHLSYETMNTAEALLRLQDETLGIIGPSEFIPMAEEIGIISEIGMWVLKEVCKFLKQLNEMYLELPSISINFSVQQLTDSQLVEKIFNTINEYEIPASLLRFEITESTFIGSSYQEILSVMEPLIAKGIHFHLDDFGTGYSNLAYVINLPFECIKLDKSLLWDIENNERMQVFVEKLVRAVSQMGAKVIIEGIETKGQQEFIRKIGCDMVQGYYFSPPLSEQDFTNTLAQNREFLLTKNGL